ncbi:MAG: hypothetical protein DLM55_00175 [Acidimicrobiales bacterium]|nr:MAG: hypothetical protein DLM55_00175 [Acidimicrobiales bacterium]
MKTWQGSLAVSEAEGIVSPAYFVCSLTNELYPRFAHYLLRSRPYIHMYRAVSKGIRPNQWDLPFEEFRKIPALLPPLDEQRRIADFLDAETGRMSQVHVRRMRQEALIVERFSITLASEVSLLARRTDEIPLRHVVVRLEQGWSPQCYDEEADSDEWGVLKTSSVSAGIFKPREHKRLPVGQNPDLRYRINDGDLLMTRGSGSSSNVGVAATAKTNGRRLLLSDLLYRLTLSEGWRAEAVRFFLASQSVRGQIDLLLRGQSGQTIKLRAEDIREIRIPHVSLAEQEKFVGHIQKWCDWTRETRERLSKSAELLAERRQALITAAVTGQIDVTTAQGIEV